jgi:hypothetical protein
MSGYGQVGQHERYVANGNATLAQQLLAAVDMPASGSYIDVSPYKWVHIRCRLGVVHASDAPTLQPKCSDAAGGTADNITDRDATTWGLHTVDPADDEEWIEWYLEVESLPTDHHFLLVDVGGTTTNGSYGLVFFDLIATDMPVTQTTATLPAASQYWLGGGVSESA